MKLILENWNKFLNEAEKESSSVSYQEMLDLIKGEDGSEIKIFIDVPKGKKKQLTNALFHLTTENSQIT